jgi:DUF1365 family protein
MTASAVYEGRIRHRRFEPVEHEFSYRLFLMYLDLEELPRLFDPFPLFSARRRAPARFRRADFMGDPRRPLAECARDAVEAETRPASGWRRSSPTSRTSPGESVMLMSSRAGEMRDLC